MNVPICLYVAGVIGTWVIAIAAIWGEGIRAKLFRPDLRLKLVSSVGKLETQLVRIEVMRNDRLFIEPKEIFVRNYRLRVTNGTRFPKAEEVYVLVTRFDKRGPDERPQPYFTDEAFPVIWRHRQQDQSSRTVGIATVADVDFMTVREDDLSLTLNMEPNAWASQREQHLWVTVVARGLNGESAPLRLKIDWNGQWHAGDTEMGQHLKIKVA